MQKQPNGTVINNDESFEEYKLKREQTKRQKQIMEDISFIKMEIISIKKILTEMNKVE